MKHTKMFVNMKNNNKNKGKTDDMHYLHRKNEKKKFEQNVEGDYEWIH